MLIQGLEPLVHKGPDWTVRAEQEQGRLTVTEYHLGTLAVRDRVTDTRQLDRMRSRQRAAFEGRARALSDWLQEVAVSRNCHKVSLIATLEHMPYFVAAGFSVEAVIDGYFQGQQTGVWMGLSTGDTGPASDSAAPPPILIDEGAGCAIFRREAGASNRWLKVQEKAMAGRAVRTIICLAGGEESGGADQLSMAGYRYRGLLQRHEMGQDGPRDLSVWIKSAAELG